MIKTPKKFQKTFSEAIQTRDHIFTSRHQQQAAPPRPWPARVPGFQQPRRRCRFARLSCHRQGFKSRSESIRLPRLPVKPVRTGSDSDRFQTGPNSNFKFKFKKNKKFLKIFQVATNLMVSNFFKYSFI